MPQIGLLLDYKNPQGVDLAMYTLLGEFSLEHTTPTSPIAPSVT